MRKLVVGTILFVSVFGFILDSRDQLSTMNATAESYEYDQGLENDDPELFAEFQMSIRTPADLQFPAYPPNYKASELKKARNYFNLRPRARTLNNTIEFKERGPGNVAGRTRALIIDPRDATRSTWIAGAVGGGIWKTTNAGNSWRNVTPDLPVLSISCMAGTPADPEILYAGTGESFNNADAIDGEGIFKSTDGGESWQALPNATPERGFGAVSRIVVDPNDPDILLAAINPRVWDFNGPFVFEIQRSVNGGDSWDVVYEGVSDIDQIIAHPTDFNILYATERGLGVIRSMDAGVTWERVGDLLRPEARIELAVTPLNPGRVFASVVGTQLGSGTDIYVSDDLGDNFFILPEINDGAEADIFFGQGTYDNTAAVHPYNQNILYAAGVNLFKYEVIEGQGAEQVIDFQEDGTKAFMDFVQCGACDFGKVDTGFVGNADIRGFRIEFAQGTQKAYRFTVGGQGAGVPVNDYIYRGQVDVPFRVFDENGTQLAVSFRDQQENFIWNLINQQLDPDDPSQDSREYIFIHDVAYSETEDPNIAVDGGYAYRNMYLIWPFLPEDAPFDNVDFVASNPGIPASQFTVVWGQGKNKRTTNLSDAYNDFDQINTFSLNQFENNQGLHPDHHLLLPVASDPGNERFYMISANDGGVYISNEGTDPSAVDDDWNYAGFGYNTTQYYGADKSPSEDRYIGGMQDNSTWVSPPGESPDSSTFYELVIGGDGFDAVWHSNDSEKFIASSQFNNFRITVDGGRTLRFPNGLSARGRGLAPFISQLGYSRSVPELLFTMGSTGVWKSSDFGLNWSSIPLTENYEFGRIQTLVEISASNANIVWAGSGMTESNRIHVSTDQGSTFSTTNLYGLRVLGSLSGLTTHPTEDSTAFALFSFAERPKILRTQDLGETWIDISGFSQQTSSSNGFPDVAVYSLLVFPNNPDRIWAGTEIGIVESQNAGESWELLESNFPAVAVWDMKIQGDQLVLGTHGRGIWSFDLADLPDILIAPDIVSVGTSPGGEVAILTDLQQQYDSVEIVLNDQSAGILRDNLTPGEVELRIGNVTEFGETRLFLRVYQEEQSETSTVVTFDHFQVNDPEEIYTNDFNSGSGEDFLLQGLEVRENVNGFSSPAIHSPHPYPDSEEQIAVLRTPIRVSADQPQIRYTNVAIVETGNPGSEFGDTDFWDFVVVEATTNGYEWTPVGPGYDASFDQRWNSLFDNSASPTESDYLNQEFSLLEEFNAGDTLLIRFRLFADVAVNSYGWVLDNLSIQEPPLGLEEDPTRLFTLRIVPNPVLKAEAVLEYELGRKEEVSMRVIDLKGRVLQNNELGTKLPGSHFFRFRADYAPGVYLIHLSAGDRIITKRLIRN